MPKMVLIFSQSAANGAGEADRRYMGPDAPCFAELGPFNPCVSPATVVCVCALIAGALQFGRIYFEKV